MKNGPSEFATFDKPNLNLQSLAIEWGIFQYKIDLRLTKRRFFVGVSGIVTFFINLPIQLYYVLKIKWFLISVSEDWTGPLNYFRNLPFNRLKNASSTKNDINKVKVPTLLLTGSSDNCVSLESIVRSTDFVEQFMLKIVDNSSHFPHQQRPDQVNQLLLSFLIGKLLQK